jgi:hypothetical protein
MIVRPVCFFIVVSLVDTVSAALPSHNKPAGRKAAYYRKDVDQQRKCRPEAGKINLPEPIPG